MPESPQKSFGDNEIAPLKAATQTAASTKTKQGVKRPRMKMLTSSCGNKNEDSRKQHISQLESDHGLGVEVQVPNSNQLSGEYTRTLHTNPVDPAGPYCYRGRTKTC